MPAEQQASGRRWPGADLARRGIAVEANPTSNLLIAQLSDYSQHPIFRLHPIRRLGGRLQVTVSTDDPGMFQTSLGEEYASLLASAIETPQPDRTETLSWLDRLRGDSWRCCFIRGPSISGQEYLDYIRTLAR